MDSVEVRYGVDKRGGECRGTAVEACYGRLVLEGRDRRGSHG